MESSLYQIRILCVCAPSLLLALASQTLALMCPGGCLVVVPLPSSIGLPNSRHGAFPSLR